MKQIPLYAIIVLLLTVGVMAFVIYNKNQKIHELEKREALKVIESNIDDKIIEEFDKIVKEKNKKLDSLKAIKNEAKYIPYEKKYYYNRGVDSALSIISDYKYDTRAKSSSE